MQAQLVIHGLNDELYNDIEEQINIIPKKLNQLPATKNPVNDNDVPNLRKGIKLPKSDSEFNG